MEARVQITVSSGGGEIAGRLIVRFKLETVGIDLYHILELVGLGTFLEEAGSREEQGIVEQRSLRAAFVKEILDLEVAAVDGVAGERGEAATRRGDRRLGVVGGQVGRDPGQGLVGDAQICGGFALSR